MCMPFCCDDCVYFIILTSLVSRIVCMYVSIFKIIKVMKIAGQNNNIHSSVYQ